MNNILIDRNGTPFKQTSETESPLKNTDVFAINCNNATFKILATEMCDPFNINDPDSNRYEKDSTKGNLKYELKTCSKECFDLYVSFLKSRNYVTINLVKKMLENS